MKCSEIEKSKPFTILSDIDDIPNSVQKELITQKTTGSIVAMSFSGHAVKTSTVPFETFIHVVTGTAEILINHERHIVIAGDSIVVAAHKTMKIKAIDYLKIISIVIKSGYEEF